MTRLITLLVSIWAFGLVCSGQVSVYRDAKYPFSLTYDSNWEVGVTSQSMIRLKLKHKVPDGFADVGIVVNVAPRVLEQTSSEQYATELAKSESLLKVMRMAMPDAKLVSTGFTYVNNKKAVFATMTGTMRGLDLELEIKLYEIILLYQGYVYVITLRADIDNYEEAFADFKSVVNSMVILPKEVQKIVRAK